MFDFRIIDDFSSIETVHFQELPIVYYYLNNFFIHEVLRLFPSSALGLLDDQIHNELTSSQSNNLWLTKLVF